MTTAAAIDLVLALLVQAQKISAMVAQAQAEKRDITEAEWALITSADDAARKSLVDAIG